MTGTLVILGRAPEKVQYDTSVPESIEVAQEKAQRALVGGGALLTKDGQRIGAGQIADEPEVTFVPQFMGG